MVLEQQFVCPRLDVPGYRGVVPSTEDVGGGGGIELAETKQGTGLAVQIPVETPPSLQLLLSERVAHVVREGRKLLPQLLLDGATHVHRAVHLGAGLSVPVHLVVELLATLALGASEAGGHVTEVVAHLDAVGVVAVVPRQMVQLSALIGKVQDARLIASERLLLLLLLLLS